MKIAIQEDSETFEKMQLLLHSGFKTPTEIVHEAIRILYQQKMDEACVKAAELQKSEDLKAVVHQDMMRLQGFKS